jgi:hypothetical protein
MSEDLTPMTRQAVVLDVATLAQEKYVYPDVGEKLAESLRAKLESGGYDATTDAGELALTLTENLKAGSHDRTGALPMIRISRPRISIRRAKTTRRGWRVNETPHDGTL